jgi:hypothetical protein
VWWYCKKENIKLFFPSQREWVGKRRLFKMWFQGMKYISSIREIQGKYVMEIKDVVIYNTDRKNVNGIYVPHDVLKKSIEKINQCFGTIGNEGTKKIDLSKVSHKCYNFVVDDNKKEVRCDIKILDTPMGNILKDVIDDLIPNAVSHCSMNGKTIEDHRLICVNYNSNNGDK